MGNIEPFNSSYGRREIEEINRELAARGRYRMGGRPVPYPLTNVTEKLQAIERMEAELRRQANIELTEHAIEAIHAIAEKHVATITDEKRRGIKGEARND